MIACLPGASWLNSDGGRAGLGPAWAAQRVTATDLAARPNPLAGAASLHHCPSH